MVNFEIKGLFAHLTLDRPDKRNAMNAEMIELLTGKFKDVAAAQNVRALILTATGDHFSAGADLNWMKSYKDKSFEENQASSRTLFKMFQALEDIPVPVIAYVQGACRGGALGLLGLCDFVVCNEDSSFGFAEVKIGLVPAVISPFVLKKMQPSFVRALMLTGDLFSANTAVKSGLAQFAGDQQQCAAEVERLKGHLALSAPQALKSCKQLLNFIEKETDFQKIEDQTTKVIAQRRSSPEGQEGLSSFFEKRVPNWVEG